MKTPDVSVGILKSEKISCSFNGYHFLEHEIEGTLTFEYCDEYIVCNGEKYKELLFIPNHDISTFTLFNVVIGINFHWQRFENQTFHGALKFVVDGDKIQAINILSVEEYLVSVISSEMNASAPLEFLKAHTVIARSWLLAQHGNHELFDVCADDHCQRYQGLVRQTSTTVRTAVESTLGIVMMYDDDICDARYSKCCGGATELFETCWEDVPHPYLIGKRDSKERFTLPDLSQEDNAREWIMSCPESFCNTNDKTILSHVLNTYDQETKNFYRWKVEYTEEELSLLIQRKTGIDFGIIEDLIPLERGTSGRICELKIVGSKHTETIGKELKIRHALSESHLYSSAFIVDKKQNGDKIVFCLHGAGWGHGVGLCQIGAAVMGSQGYTFDEILEHYYPGVEFRQLYHQ